MRAYDCVFQIVTNVLNGDSVSSCVKIRKDRICVVVILDTNW